MKFDLETLIKILGKEQPENSSGEVRLQQRYLYQNVFLPISQGRNVWVKDLDFSQFTSSDIIDLDEYLDDIASDCTRLVQYANLLRRAQPVAHTTPMFI